MVLASGLMMRAAWVEIVDGGLVKATGVWLLPASSLAKGATCVGVVANLACGAKLPVWEFKTVIFGVVVIPCPETGILVGGMIISGSLVVSGETVPAAVSGAGIRVAGIKTSGVLLVLGAKSILFKPGTFPAEIVVAGKTTLA